MSPSSTAPSSPTESNRVFDQPENAKMVAPSNALNIIHPPAAIFNPTSLKALRTHLELFSNPSGAALNSFSPFRALRRIQVSYPTIESAVGARRAMANPSFFDRFVSEPAIGVRISFARPVPVVVAHGSDGSDGEGNGVVTKKYLKAPTVDKLHFISPPPSPPAGWEVRFEDPPNKTTHPDDLVRGIWGGFAGTEMANSSSPTDHVAMSGIDDAERSASHTEEGVRVERRSSSTTYFYDTTQRRNSDSSSHMVDNGNVPVALADEADDVLVIHVNHPDDEAAEQQPAPKTIIAHTARPPA